MYGGGDSRRSAGQRGHGDRRRSMVLRSPAGDVGRRGAERSRPQLLVAGTLGVTALTWSAAPLADIALKLAADGILPLMLYHSLTTVERRSDRRLRSPKAHLGLPRPQRSTTVGIDLQSGGRASLSIFPRSCRRAWSFLVAVVGLFTLAEVSRMVEETLRGPDEDRARRGPHLVHRAGVAARLARDPARDQRRFLLRRRARARRHDLGHAGLCHREARVAASP